MDNNQDNNQDNKRLVDECMDKLKAQKKEIMELEEGHDLIYKTLRSAEGIKEIMTGSEPECIAESVKFYVEGFHEKEDEIEGLRNNITSLVQEVGKSYQAARGCLQNLAFVGE